MATHRTNWSKIIAFDGTTLTINEGSKTLSTTDLERVAAQMEDAGFTKLRSKRVSQVARRIMRTFRRRETPPADAVAENQVGKLSKAGWTCFAFLADDEEVLKAAHEGQLTNQNVADILEAVQVYSEEATSNVKRSMSAIVRRLKPEAA